MTTTTKDEVADEGQLSTNAQVLSDDSLGDLLVALDKAKKAMKTDAVVEAQREWGRLRNTLKEAKGDVRARVEELQGPFRPDEERELIVNERFIYTGRLRSYPAKPGAPQTRYTDDLRDFA